MAVSVTDTTGATATDQGAFTSQAAAPKVTGPLGPAEMPAGLGFWWGFAIGGVAIAIAGIVGGYRWVLARQGREIVTELQVGHGAAGTASTASSEDPTPPAGLRP